jgi:hypothetical protein
MRMKNKYRIAKYKRHTKDLYVIERYVPERKAIFWLKAREGRWVRCLLTIYSHEDTIRADTASTHCTTFDTLKAAKDTLEALLIEEAEIEFVEVVRNEA